MRCERRARATEKLLQLRWDARSAACLRTGDWEAANVVVVRLSVAIAATQGSVARSIHKSRSTIRFMDRAAPPPLLPIFRSRQQAELLALILGDPELELSLTDLAARLGTPYPSVHREIERAEAAGLVSSRKVGNTRLVRANTASPYFRGLAELLARAFGVPSVLAEALRSVAGVASAFVYGSWAARFVGSEGQRPVEDIDLLVLGEPDRDTLYGEIERVEARLGRPVQVTIRDADWLATGTGSFHDTVVSRPMVPIPLEGAEPSAG